MTQPFVPTPNATVNISVSATSQSVLLGSPTQVRVMNDGTATVWIAFGASSVTTTATTGFPVPAGAIEVLTVPYPLGSAPIYAAAIAAAASGKVYFTPGAGI